MVTTPLQRVSNDFYPTPEPVTEALLNAVDLQGKVLEPCAGHGAISDVLRSGGCTVLESDLVWESEVGAQPMDASEEKFWQYWDARLTGIDWTVTNPPFSLAEAILPLAFQYSAQGCAFLLRLSYLEPTKGRRDFLASSADCLRYVIPVSPRVRFRSDTRGSESVTCAWFVWDKSFSWRGLAINSPFRFLVDWR